MGFFKDRDEMRAWLTRQPDSVGRLADEFLAEEMTRKCLQEIRELQLLTSILINKMGGEVSITDEELVKAEMTGLETFKSDMNPYVTVVKTTPPQRRTLFTTMRPIFGEER